MKFTKIIGCVLLVSCMWLWTGCASLFSSKNQKLTFSSATKDATITYKGDSIGRGTVKKKMDKQYLFHSVEAKKKGHITKSYSFELTGKLSPTIAFTVLNGLTFIGAPFLIWLDFRIARNHKFDKRHSIPALTPLQPRQSDEKYLVTNNIAFEVQAKDVRAKKYKHIKHYNKRIGTIASTEKKSKKIAKHNISVSNSMYTDELNNTLVEMGFMDTSKHIFVNASNSLYLDATIKKIVFHQVEREMKIANNAFMPNELVSVQMETEWRVLDYYKQPVYTITIEKSSDLYMVEPGNEKYTIPLRKAISANFELSLADIRKQLAEKGLLKKAAGGQDTTSWITLEKPTMPGETTRLNEMLKSAVTLKVDDGHGSGIIVSEDGYIISNYHVVAGAKTIEVIFNDETKAIATVIKVSPGADLALLKVEKTGLKALPITDVVDPEIGIDVWAMGTPKSLELGQSISKGIISGLRKANDLSYIQTDVKISPGNSGGALINRKGEITGIVTSKLIGFGAEGVGFAISAHHVLENLRIKYK